MSPPASPSGEIPPVLFDFQVNGFAGVDFQDEAISAAQLARALTALRRHRVARFFVTLITDDVDRLARRFARFETLRAASADAAHMIAGYHLEGPWLNPTAGFCGAHAPRHMHAPTLAEFEDLQAAAGGHIRLVTLAPEWPGSAAFIRHLADRGIHVSLGHTDASDAQIDLAIAAGARFCTHLGNGTPGLLPRHDNITQRLLARDELTACFIPDGVHLPPFVLRNFFRAKPTGRALFTTDAMAGAGAPPGRYTIGTLEIDIGPDRIARPPGGEGFAGSTLVPDEGVRRVTDWLRLAPAEAVRLWSSAAAAAFGVSLG